MSYTVTKNGKTYDDMLAEINALIFKDVWKEVLIRIYIDCDFNNINNVGQTDEEYYDGIDVFKLIDGNVVAQSKELWLTVSSELSDYKSDLSAALIVEFDELQRRHDLYNRLNDLKHLSSSKNASVSYQGYTNSELVKKAIVDADDTVALAAIEAEDASFDLIAQRDGRISKQSEDMKFGQHLIALINDHNEQNNITETQLLTMLADGNVQLIMSLLNTGSLNTARAKIQSTNVAGLEPMDNDLKDELMAKIDEYNAV